MPRKLRFPIPDGVFHVNTRSVFERHAFDDVEDRLDFLGVLAKVVELYEWRCLSYCLLGTHYHLVVHTPNANLSLGMQQLNGQYAQRFNWRKGRRGHLFGERFYSVQIKTDGHLFAALRYVALNPVAAGLCENAADWRWSSYRSIVGLEPPLRLLEVEDVLRLFPGSRQAARTQFARFVNSTLTADPADKYTLVRTAGV